MSMAALALLSVFFVAVRDARAGDADLFGAYGPEGPRLREQLWILPSGDEHSQLRATVFRPADDPASPPPRRPLVVINHGTSEETRLALSMPVYYWLSRWFVERGYVVVLPQRRGHGATGGPLAESIGTCTNPDHVRSGQIAADDIEAAIEYMTRQPFVAPRETVVVGISTGGWASLALASRNPPSVRAVINFAGGRGAHAFGQPNHICAEQRLIDAAGAYGTSARIPTVWLYARNDTYFGPELALAMARSWREGGGSVELHVLPPYGADGHVIADDRAGWDLWGSTLDSFLAAHNGPPVVVSEHHAPSAAASDAVSPASLTVHETGSVENR